mgnify:CR=1 FL=1
MTHEWKKVRLGEVLRHIKEPVALNPEATYAQVTIRMYGKGVVKRGDVVGSEVGSKQYVARSNQFIISRIDARNGAFGLVPEELEGAIVTSDFLLFDCDERLSPDYLRFYSSTPDFTAACRNASEGTTNRVRLQVNKFLAAEIPLPPLATQRRLVARLQAVQAQVTQVQAVRARQAQEMGALARAAFREATHGAPRRPLAEVAPITRRPVQVSQTDTYPELGIRSFGRGTFHKPAVPGSEVGTKKLYYVAPGDVLFSNVFAWEGAIAVVQPADAGRVGSHRFISCVCNPALAVPEFVAFYFLTPEGLAQVNAASPGGAGRNKTLGLEKLERLQIPLPPLAVQQQFVALQAHLTALRTAHAATAAELAQVLPSVLGEVFGGGG